jgi:diguanylate cyclase (GGDEF)-like protein
MSKTHDFTNILWGEEFDIESSFETAQVTVTGEGSLESGDHVVLCIKCHVDEVQHYSNTPEIWRAKFSVEKPISLENTVEKNPLQTIQKVITQLGDSLNQKELYQRIESAFTTDRVSQVANRGRFESRLTEEWKQMRRDKAPISLIFCSFNGLTAYQEVYGVQAMEKCLQSIAETLQSCINRPSDVVARYQDHMFAILLPNTPETGVQSVVQLIRSECSALPYCASNSKPAITLQLGAATMSPNANQESNSLIQAAAKSIA